MRVRVRNRPGVHEHRRAGINFVREYTTHDVTAEQLKLLQADDVLEVEQIDHEAADGLDSMTVAQLRSAAHEAGLEGYERLRKAELVELLRSGTTEDDDAETDER